MSGPKVVRIVTREELIAICEGQLARVDAALAEWVRIGARHECVSDTERATAEKRRDALAALIAANQFTELQKQAPQEEAFLRSDLQTRLAKVAAEQAAARSRERRSAEASASLLAALQRSGLAISAELEAALAAGDGAAFAQGFELLAKRSGQDAATQAHARALREDGAQPTFAAWLAEQGSAPADPAIERLEARICALALAGAARVAAWRDRLSEALAEGDAARRGLILDGLEVDLAKAFAAARAHKAAADGYFAAIAELEAADAALVAQCAIDVGQASVAQLNAATARAQTLLAQQRAAAAAIARRAAVLQGLAGLGYEVAEGMATAWVEQGRLVLRKPATPGYGVEMSGAAEGGRLQMRVVALIDGGAGPDPGRDRDAETLWCGEVASLEQTLAASGGGLVIERALAVGATPLKRIAIGGGADETMRAAPAPKARTLD